MSKLDQKTIRNLKVEFVNEFDAKEELRKLFTSLRYYKTRFKPNDEHVKIQIKYFRNKIHNLIRSQCFIRIKFSLNDEISTYYRIYSASFDTVSDFGSNARIGARRWVANRIREKFREYRVKQRTPIPTIKQFGDLRYELHGGTFLLLNSINGLKENYYMSAIDKEKYPHDEENSVGVEIEFLSYMSEWRIKKALVAARLHEYVLLKYDGSVEADCDDNYIEYDEEGEIMYPNGYELTIVSPENEIIDLTTKALVTLKTNCNAWVNNTCGLHVHLDMRNRNYKKVYNNLYKIQDILFAFVDESRQDNTYCTKIDDGDWDSAIEDRYQGINALAAYGKFETIEVRIHEGTLNKIKVAHWLRLLIRVANYKKWVNSRIDQVLDVKKVFKIEENTYNYFKRHIS